MLLELGPVNAAQALSWTRFARRLIAEVRTDPCDLEDVTADRDLLGQWSSMIDQWAEAIGDGEMFRWTQTVDDEMAEFLLHGFTRWMASPSLSAKVSADEHLDHDRFTQHVAKAFISGLSIEGYSCEHYRERIRGLSA